MTHVQGAAATGSFPSDTLVRSLLLGLLKEDAYTHCMVLPRIDLDSLTADEKLELIDRLWDSLGSEPDHLPLTPAQRAELDRRLEEEEALGEAGESWPDVRRQIEDELS